MTAVGPVGIGVFPFSGPPFVRSKKDFAVRFDENEPVFKRSKWGTNRYEYNPDNPVGLALIVLSVAFAAVMLILMHNHAGPFALPPDPTPASWSPPPDMSRWAPPAEIPSTDPTPASSDSP